MRPSRAGASARSSTAVRGGGTSAISASAASMRNFGLDVRAGGPRRSQASSLRSRFCRRASLADGLPVALGPGQHVGGVAAVELRTAPSATSQVRSHDRVQEPAVVGDDQQRAAAGASGSRPARSTPSMSRWLVGSSSTSRSAWCTSAAASATRRRSPPDSRVDRRRPGPARPARARSAPRGPRRRRPTRARRRRRPRPSRTVAPAGRSPRWSTQRDPEAAGAGDPTGVRRFSAGDQPQQRRLAAAVAPDHADPLAVARCRATRRPARSSSRRPCRPFSRLTRFGHQRGDSRAGSRARSRPGWRGRPGPRSQFDREIAARRRRRAQRNAHVGPDPDTIPPSAPSSTPAARTSSSSGRSDSAAGCEVVGRARRRPDRSHRRAARRAARPAAPIGSGAVPGCAQPVELAVHIDGRQAEHRRARTPSGTRRSPGTGVSCSPRPVPSAVPPVNGNATSLPSSAASVDQLRARRPGRHSAAHATQRRRRVGRAAGHPAGDRDRSCAVRAGRRRTRRCARPAAPRHATRGSRRRSGRPARKRRPS